MLSRADEVWQSWFAKVAAKAGSKMLLFRFPDGSSILLSARLVAPLLWCGQAASSVSGDLGPAALCHLCKR